MNGYTDGWMADLVFEWMFKLMGEWMDGWMAELVFEWMVKLMKG
jgi:hypothetical protein